MFPAVYNANMRIVQSPGTSLDVGRSCGAIPESAADYDG